MLIIFKFWYIYLHRMELKGLSTQEAIQQLLDDLQEVIEEDKLEDITQNR